jgi:hypothetical protein
MFVVPSLKDQRPGRSVGEPLNPTFAANVTGCSWWVQAGGQRNCRILLVHRLNYVSTARGQHPVSAYVAFIVFVPTLSVDVSRHPTQVRHFRQQQTIRSVRRLTRCVIVIRRSHRPNRIVVLPRGFWSDIEMFRQLYVASPRLSAELREQADVSRRDFVDGSHQFGASLRRILALFSL